LAGRAYWAMLQLFSVLGKKTSAVPGLSQPPTINTAAIVVVVVVVVIVVDVFVVVALDVVVVVVVVVVLHSTVFSLVDPASLSSQVLNMQVWTYPFVNLMFAQLTPHPSFPSLDRVAV